MKAILLSLALVLTPAAALAANPPELIGDWQGVLDIEGTKLTLVFHVGADRVTADSPDQGARNLPGSAGTNGSALTLGIPMVAARFEGKLSADGKTLSGVFYQGGISPSLTLTKISTTPTLPPIRPTPAELKGEWEGASPTPNGTVTLAFHLTDTPNADVPGQATGVPVLIDKTADGFKLEVAGVVFNGKLSADGKSLEGTLTAGNQSAPMKLTRK
jgi:hypothetical protein